MDPETSCALHAGGSRVTASGEVTVWFTQSREGAKEGGKAISFSSSLRLCGFV
jgi:hypothetical protein